MFACHLSKVRIVKYLLVRNANVDTLDNNGATALMRAARYSNIECVTLLLKQHANVNIKRNNGDTALILTKSKEIGKILIEYGSDIGAYMCDRINGKVKDYFKDEIEQLERANNSVLANVNAELSINIAVKRETVVRLTNDISVLNRQLSVLQTQLLNANKVEVLQELPIGTPTRYVKQREII
eukprot:NODE_360_length_10152_cov_0.555556.p3 type:complete len:183 gc:universal NODE_360_length_10152_cov_0.555556:2933-2385(-)